MTEIVGEIKFEPKNEALVSNNSLFLDASDNKLKFKDDNGEIIIF